VNKIITRLTEIVRGALFLFLVGFVFFWEDSYAFGWLIYICLSCCQFYFSDWRTFKENYLEIFFFHFRER
jgi:hypothetical protein